MGFTHGTGLGADGKAEPVEAVMRKKRAGLGPGNAVVRGKGFAFLFLLCFFSLFVRVRSDVQFSLIFSDYPT